MKDTHQTSFLSCCTWLVKYYLEKWFVIIKQNSKNLSSVANEGKQIIHVIKSINQTLLWNFTYKLTM